MHNQNPQMLTHHKADIFAYSFHLHTVVLIQLYLVKTNSFFLRMFFPYQILRKSHKQLNDKETDYQQFFVTMQTQTSYLLE